MIRIWVPAALSLLALAGCGERGEQADDAIQVQGQASTSAPARPAPEEVSGQPFVATVLGALDFSIAGANAVAERGEHANAKALAQKVSSEFAGARAELAQVAQAGGLKAEGVSAPTHASDLAILSSTGGAPLDIAFAKQQVDALTLLVGTVRAYKNGGDNPALKAWAEKYQGVIGERLLDIQTLNAELEGNG
ncbi:DUF4142 domain-containing protein [Sphingomonas sp. ID1715]|nr:DUF4142 domain-containing protein [Sphingomonas sp. ID1715]